VKANVNRLCSRIRKKEFSAVCIATACTSFSLAQNWNGKHRSLEQPLGLPGLTGKKLDSVRLGNALARATAKVIAAPDAAGIPWLLENPSASYLWWQPCLQKYRDDQRVHRLCLDQCQYGTKYRKRTGLWTTAHRGVEELSKRCGGRGGICSRTGCKHIELTGDSFVRRASEYPTPMADSIAHCLWSSRAHPPIPEK